MEISPDAAINSQKCMENRIGIGCFQLSIPAPAPCPPAVDVLPVGGYIIH